MLFNYRLTKKYVNNKIETQTSGSSVFDATKWLLAVALVVGGIYAYYHYDQYPVLYRVLALIPVVIAALLAAVWTQGGERFWNLVKQARLEIYKVVWPTRQETVQTTAIVLLVVFVIALILWLLDMFFGWLASAIIG
jgi:preprotein translocase subunit SecE